MEKLFGVNLVDNKLLEGGHEAVRKLKHYDSKIFADFLFYEGEIVEPVFDEKLVKKANVIDMVNINSDDIAKSISYIDGVKEKFKEAEVMLDYKVFTEEEMKQNMNNIIDEIIKFIDDKGLIKL